MGVRTVKLHRHDSTTSSFLISSCARTCSPLKSTFTKTWRQDGLPLPCPPVRRQQSFVRARAADSPPPSSSNRSSDRTAQQNSANHRRGSVARRAAVTSEPTPESGGEGSMRLPSAGSLFRKIASSIPLPRQSRPSQPSSPPTTSTASSPPPSTAAGNSSFSGSTVKSSAGIRPRSKSGGDTDLDPSRALPLPMTYPDSKPLSLETVEDMVRCDPETQNCKEVVFQWTGKCSRCNGAGFVTFRRKKGKDFSGKCITCHGIGYVNRFTVRDDIPLPPSPAPLPCSLPLLPSPAPFPCPLPLPTSPAHFPCPLPLPTSPAHFPCPLPLPTSPAHFPCPLPLPTSPAHFPCPLPLPTSPALFPCPLPLPTSPAHFPCPLPLPTSPAHFPCPLPLPTSPAHFPCPLPLPPSPALFPCPLPLPSSPAHFPCPLPLPSSPALFPCPLSPSARHLLPLDLCFLSRPPALLPLPPAQTLFPCLLRSSYRCSSHSPTPWLPSPSSSPLFSSPLLSSPLLSSPLLSSPLLSSPLLSSPLLSSPLLSSPLLSYHMRPAPLTLPSLARFLLTLIPPTAAIIAHLSPHHISRPRGMPLTLEPAILKELVPPPSLLTKVVDTITGGVGGASATATAATAAANMPAQLGRFFGAAGAAVANSVAQSFTELREQLDVTVAPSGLVERCDVYGEAHATCRMSGMPDVALSFVDARVFSDIAFHPSVRYREWDSDRVVALTPPDGNFKLLSYRVRSIPCVPVYIKPQIAFVGDSGRVNVMVGVKHDPGKPVEGLVLLLPLPLQVASCDLQANVGTVAFDTITKLCTWSIGRMPRDKNPCLSGGLRLSSPLPRPHVHPVLLAHFRIMGAALSGVRIESVVVRGEESRRPHTAFRSATVAGYFQGGTGGGVLLAQFRIMGAALSGVRIESVVVRGEENRRPHTAFRSATVARCFQFRIMGAALSGVRIESVVVRGEENRRPHTAFRSATVAGCFQVRT
ncbi:unnamed protein product [Closterium sp. Yama58-4]|nr:unnamed protein product [Closterium sp. Yama58-4]